MKIWTVDMEEEAERELKKMLKEGIVTRGDVAILRKWVDEMEEYGPDFIAKSPEWHDHELEREWAGFRSSAFSSAGRIIYKILKEQIVVRVVRVTTNHDYRLR